MGTSPTTQSAQLSGAAKDDVVGLNGDFNFTIADLLANDPGAVAKLNLSSQFFFGNITDYNSAGQVVNGIPTIAAQKTYLAAHGITANIDPLVRKIIITCDKQVFGGDEQVLVATPPI
jgi:hypothetical protein